MQQRRVEIDIDLADLAAFNGGGRDIGDLLDLRRDRIEGQVVERPFVEIVARDRHDRDRNVGDVELDDKGLQNAGREAVQNLGDALHHLHLADVDVRAPVEPDLHRADALLGERLDMFDIRGGTDGFLDRDRRRSVRCRAAARLYR